MRLSAQLMPRAVRILILTLAIGGIVGFIVVSMYMPLFTVYNQIK